MEFRMFLCLGCPWNLRLEKSSQVTLNPFLHCSPGAKISHAQKNLTVNFHLIEKKKKKGKDPHYSLLRLLLLNSKSLLGKAGAGSAGGEA